MGISKWTKKATRTNMKFALTICLLAVLAIAAEARHVKKTQNRGNAKMLSLIEKMNKQRVPDSFPAQVEHYCETQYFCCFDQDHDGHYNCMCCDDADNVCCNSDSPTSVRPVLMIARN